MSLVFDSRRAPLPEIPSQIQDWLRHQSDYLEHDGPEPAAPWIRPTKDTLDWVKGTTTAHLKSFATDARDNIEYAFGVEASELCRRTRNRRSSDCYIRVRNTNPTWEVQIRFDSDVIRVSPPDSLSLLRRVFATDKFQSDTTYSRSISRIPPSDSRLRMWTFKRRDLYHTWTSNLYHGWPKRTVHLPAGRTGIMQSYKVIAGAVVRQSAAAGIRPIEIDPLPGTAADFLSILLEPNGGLRSYRAAPRRPYGQVIHLIEELENALGASIRRDRSADSGDMVVAVTPEGHFPMSRVSSMLSELAPVLLVLKGYTRVGDHITIDEPEAHLHPSMQRNLASFVTDVVSKGIRMVITTHSDFFVGQINNSIRSGKLDGVGEGGPSGSKRVCALQFSREEAGYRGTLLDIDPVSGIDESTFTDVMTSLYDESAELIDELLT